MKRGYLFLAITFAIGVIAAIECSALLNTGKAPDGLLSLGVIMGVFMAVWSFSKYVELYAESEPKKKEEPMEGIQPGDMVNLKVSAHPKMVVNYRTMSGYACCWFDDNMVCQEHIFAEEALELFKKSEG